MQEQLAQIFYYARGALKHKWLALIVAWVVCLSGWLFVFAMPNKYVSEAKVHVETKTMLQPLLRGMTIQSDTTGLLRIMQVLMFTRNNLEQIIKMSDLDKNSDVPEQSVLIERLKKEIKIEGGRDDVFTIKFEAKSATLAKNVVQAVLTVFSEQTHQSTLAGTDVAKKFIEDQIQEYETRLRNAEKNRENFKRANLGLLPGEGGDQVGQVQAIATQLEEAQLLLKGALSRKDALLAQLNEVKQSKENWGGTDINQRLSEQDAILDALLTRKKELLVRYTEKHPEVVSITKAIELRKRKHQAQQDPLKKDNLVTPSVMANPYIQTIKVALNEAEAEVASQQARVDQLKLRVDRIKDELNSRLTIETELQNLNRDYDAIKSNYEKLIESREQANMSEKVDDQAEALKFKIADAPNTPLKPSSPKREYFYSGLLVVGFIVGFGLSLLLYMVKPTIMSTAQLGQITGLPVLGGVSMKNNSAEIAKNKTEIVRYYCAVMGLVIIYFGFMAIEILEMNAKLLGLLKHWIN